MKRLLLLLGVAWGAVACGDDSEIFYSVTYPVVQIDAVVTLTSGEGSAADAALVETITAEVVAEAPVQVGGWYRLDFSSYNGGPLTLLRDPAGEPLVGEFVKEPGTTLLQFACEGLTYSCSLSSYFPDEGARCVLLIADLTEEFQERYPEAGITRVQRREYTTTPQQ